MLALILAITIVAPKDGSMVPLLRSAHKDYLARDRSERVGRLDDAAYRRQLVRSGHVQQPVKLVWTNAADEAAVTVVVETAGRTGSVYRQTFAITNSNQAYITNLELGKAYRWSVRSGGDEASAFFVTESMPPRLMRIEGVVNARDLGGWTGLDGRKIRQDMIFRSAGFREGASSKDKSVFANRFESGKQRITSNGVSYLRGEIGVKTDLEVRGATEAVCMDSSVLGQDVRFIKEPFPAYNFIDHLIRGREPFARLFRVFEKSENYPVVFHCEGGRDRTGTLAFLLLGLLGASDDDLCRDWEASAFSAGGVEFDPARLDRLIAYLVDLGGDSLAEDCEIFAKSCGVTDESIARFREIMLEKEGVK